MVNDMILDDFISQDFFDFIDVSEKTESIYRRALRQMFKYFIINLIDTPERKDILNFRHYLEQRKLKPSTIALYLTACRRFFLWAEYTGSYKNIAAFVKSPKQEYGHKRDCLSAEQMQNVLDHIDRSTPKGRRNYAIVALMAVGGLRTIEVVRANIEDLRNEWGHMCLYIQGKGCNSKTDFVKVPAPVYKAILESLRDRGSVEDTAHLFVSRSYRNMDERLTTRALSLICKEAMKAAGYDSPRLTAHSLRHTAVTLSLMSGIPLCDVQAFARHKCVTTTMVYAHHVDRLNSTCEDTISDAIFR